MHDRERADLISLFSARITRLACLRQSLALSVVDGRVSTIVLEALDRCIFADYTDLHDLGAEDAARTALVFFRRG